MASDLRARLQAALADRYTIERELGRGGMAIVFLAKDVRHGRVVALKALRPELAATLGTDRFLREIRLAAGLAHPHILPLHDSGDAGGCLYYVMPYVAGESLRDRLEREPRLSVGEAVQIAREVADALDYAHRHGVVHRDIKPENILLQEGLAVVADFGIARAISAAAGRKSRVTEVGIAVGTPDYMSPEQASADQTLDGRSDVYSLGCVLHEMLTGHPPRHGGSATEDALPAGTPPEVRAAIMHALTPDVADRFPTAGAFAAALASEPRQPAGRRWPIVVGAAVVLGAIAVGLLPRLLGAGLDEAAYVVVPFAHGGGAPPRLVDGDRCQALLYAAMFGRWADVKLQDEFLVQDALRQRRIGRPTIGEALKVARELRAGRLVWGEVSGYGDTVEVRAALYDVSRRELLRQRTVRFGQNLRAIEARFQELADSLLLGSARSPGAAGGAIGTSVIAAWEAYQDGHAALARWDLPAAERAFRTALDADPQYSHAALWLTQTLMLAGKPVESWRSYAAARPRQPFGPRERALADGLSTLAAGAYPQACAAYERLVRSDSEDFWAWFGLGECRARDGRVVSDPASPSGWRFRSSYQAAATAYRRALELVPSVHRAFGALGWARLTRLFFIEPRQVRWGFAPARDTLWFGAFPSLSGDTLAFVPYPIADVARGRPEAMPPSIGAAVARNRALLRDIATGWVRGFPDSPDAHETLALVLETLSEISEVSPSGQSALATARRGRALARDSLQRLRLAATEVRLLVKVGAFGQARALADSLLRAAPATSPEAAEQLAGLAVLTGRVYRAADLLSQTAPIEPLGTWDGQAVSAPTAVKEAWLRLLAYASLGAPVDSLRAGLRRVEQLVASYVEPERRALVRDAALHQAMSLAYPQVGLSVVHRASLRGNNYLLELQWLLAHGDSAAIRQRLAGLRRLRANLRPGDVSIDATYSEAWLLLALGDSALARDELDLSLNALPTLGLNLVTRTAEAGALVRAMALRAELAEHQGDRPTASRWAAAVLALWANADPPLATTIGRMRQVNASGERE